MLKDSVSRASDETLFFDTLVASVLLYGAQVWGPSLDHHGRSSRIDGWGGMEKPLVSMISRLIRAKASVSHDII